MVDSDSEHSDEGEEECEYSKEEKADAHDTLEYDSGSGGETRPLPESLGFVELAIRRGSPSFCSLWSDRPLRQSRPTM